MASSHDVQVILLTRDKPFYPLEADVSLAIPELSKSDVSPVIYYMRMLMHIRNAIKKHGSEVVFSFGETLNPFFLISSLFLSGLRRIVLNRANPWSSLEGIRGILNPIVYPLADRVVVQTCAARKILKKRYNFCDFAVIANPVSIPRRVPVISNRRKVVISVGSLGGKKNQAALIRCFARVASGTAWVLRIVGDGPDREQLERLGRSAGLLHQIEFLGERRDISELLLDAQVFAFASLSEGFPNALAEGLAHGCACISFECPTGPADLINNGANGLLVPVGDEEVYAQKLECLLNDEALRNQLGEQAKLDMEDYSTDNIIGQFAQLI